jgi:hypothetical protein
VLSWFSSGSSAHYTSNTAAVVRTVREVVDRMKGGAVNEDRSPLKEAID